MLTSFFATSKPLNFIVIIIMVITFFLCFNLEVINTDFSPYNVLIQFAILILYLFTIGVLNFVVKRNTLTKKNTYLLFFFICFTFSLPVCFSNPSVITSSLFLLLALRRIISMRSQLELQKKIFDAALWITVASLFYFWSILFLLVLYAGILFHGTNSYKNWLIPILSIFVVLIFCLTYAVYNDGVMSFIRAYFDKPSFDFTPYSNLKLLVPISFLFALYLWCAIKYIALVTAVSQKLKSSYLIILLSSLVTLIIAVVFAPIRDGSEFYFALGPLAIIVSRYIEKSNGFWFKEMVLIMTLALPVIMYFMS
ncbi:MAG: DUF6427 family protein [Leeuwenhoekiella sp.]